MVSFQIQGNENFSVLHFPHIHKRQEATGKTRVGRRRGMLVLLYAFIKILMAPMYYGNYWLKDHANYRQRFWSRFGGSVDGRV